MTQKTRPKQPSLHTHWHILTLYSFIIVLLVLSPLVFLSFTFKFIADLLFLPAKHIMRDMMQYTARRDKSILKQLEAFNKQLTKKNAKTNKR